MLHTSIGFHTFTIYKQITKTEGTSLLENFKAHSDVTHEINIYPVDDRKEKYIITYCSRLGEGAIKWFLSFNDSQSEFKTYSIKATINPKILTGIRDYITASNENCLEAIEGLFNIEAGKISKILGRFSSYSLHRIDYCINFDLCELGINAKIEDMMALIKRSNIPHSFKERAIYDKTSHRQKTDKISLYLENQSVTVNCYCKGKQLERKYPNNVDIAEAKNVIRFEIQCKYKKVYTMSRIASKNILSEDIIYNMLSNDVSSKVVINYYKKIIMEGNYYRLSDAIQRVKDYHFKPKKEKRLIKTLERINRYRSVTKAKESLINKENKAFKRSLIQLAEHGINPVTIPKKMNLKYIPNLLERFISLM